MMQALLRGFVVLFCALILFSAIVPAQSAENQQVDTFDQRKLLVPHKNSDGSIKVISFLADPVLWARQEQQNFYGAMSKTLRAIKEGNTVDASLTLMFLSFAYGVLHAAGPGHGKAVISGWLLATENQLRRGVLVAFMSAVVQAITAITIVTALYLFVSSVGSAAKDVAGFLETASYGLIAVMGGYLFWTGVQPLLADRLNPTAAKNVEPSSDHHFEIVNHLPHVHGPGCGHAHVPTARELPANLDWSKAFSLAFAVGIRPCTGALLVLVFANTIGIYWAGIASTFAMAMGTFITVSVIATIAVYSKQLAERLVQRDTRWLNWLTIGLRLAAGCAILLFGIVLMLGSFGGPSGNL